MSLCPVILAGGGGTRLWPLSRQDYPKQFLRLFGEYTMLQETLKRCDGLESKIQLDEPMVICNTDYRFIVQEQAQQIGKKLQSIILEPEGRNTAPALTLAAISQLEQGNDPVLLMMPADHLIKDLQGLQRVFETAYQLALKNHLVTFGITPDKAETGYGYIHCKNDIETGNAETCLEIESFTEKPNAEVAQQYLDSESYFWNSGLFMLRASLCCELMQALQPEIYSASYAAYTKGQVDGDFYHLHNESFLQSPSDSIDYAVMEKLSTQNVTAGMMVLKAGWSDIGAWTAVWEQSEKDQNNNVISGDVIQIDSRDCLVRSENRLVSLVGCENLAIIETSDALMITNKDNAQGVKQIVEQLKREHRKEQTENLRVKRPWGSYETVDNGDGFKVKRIIVNPGKKLSLQLHHKRSEHWVVVKGTATITNANETFDLKENESTFIPMETKHRLENATTKPLEIIEVQVGSYLGEDDIVRFDDDFGRQDKPDK